MVRTIIVPKDNKIEITILNEYIGKPIEITYLALDELENVKSKTKTMADFIGILSDEQYKELKQSTESLRKEWDRNF